MSSSTYSWLLRTMSRQFLNSDSTVNSLINLVILTVKNVSVLPDVFEEVPVFKFVPTVSHPVPAWLDHPFRFPSGIHGHS